MTQTKLQRKRLKTALFWGGILSGIRKGAGAQIIREMEHKNRATEKRKRAQFRGAKP